MWRVRQKEIELDDRLRSKSREGHSASRSRGSFKPSRDFDRDIPSSSSPPSKRVSEDCHLMEDEGLKDEELEVFLHSRYLSLSLSLCLSVCLSSNANPSLFVPWLDALINVPT